MKPPTDDERHPPEKIRVTKLQEAQLLDLVAIEARCAEMFYARGFDASEVAPRSETDLARLPRAHEVLVAEADDHPAGFLVWSDEAPGVAILHDLSVDPERQRFGIATRLLVELGERAHGHGIATVVAAPWQRATFSLSFLAVRGFSPVREQPPPSRLAAWVADRGTEVASPGRSLWWAPTDGLGLIPGLPRPRTIPP
ncbi:MAG: GNAT family N-acetyltransferase [Myxococcota bacterium]